MCAKITDQALLSAFKSGLNVDVGTAVLAANPVSFTKADEIAMAAEAARKDHGVAEGIFHARHAVRGVNKSQAQFRGGPPNLAQRAYYPQRGQRHGNDRPRTHYATQGLKQGTGGG